MAKVCAVFLRCGQELSKDGCPFWGQPSLPYEGTVTFGISGSEFSLR